MAKRDLTQSQVYQQAQAEIDAEQQASDQDQAVINELAALHPLEYERSRATKAKELGIRASLLDGMVKAARKEQSGGGLIQFGEVTPWHAPINPAALLDEITASIQRFIVCKPETANAAALWAAMAWFIDAVQVAPLAVITAPEKRCGKSQLLNFLGRMVRQPLQAAGISPAALYRTIEALKPTLLIDETDALLRDNEEMRGLINAGHTRDSAFVIRLVGDNHTPTKFSVWGAKALSGIGKLADTLMDRAIILELRRKLPNENVDRLRHAEPALFDTLAAKLARFSVDYSEAIRQARPNLPTALNDRAQDNWEPLLAIADIAGGHWPHTARQAALLIAKKSEEEATQSTGVELLADIQEIFEINKKDRITTAELIEALCSDDEKAWATYNRGRPLAPRQLGNRLHEFGIQSKNLKIRYREVNKGFELAQFTDSFTRYLSDSCRYPLQNPENPHCDAVLHGSASNNGNATGSLYPLHATQNEEHDRVADKGGNRAYPLSATKSDTNKSSNNNELSAKVAGSGYKPETGMNEGVPSVSHKKIEPSGEMTL